MGRRFILRRIQRYRYQPVETGETGYTSRVLFERVKRVVQDIFNVVQFSEGKVREPFFADLVPEVLDGIEFGAVGWQADQPHVIGHLEICSLVPAGAVEHQEDEFVSMTPGDFIEKDGHCLRIDDRENQRVQGPIVRTDGCEGMGVFAHKVSADDRPNAWGHPASVKIVDAAEAGFVLEHEPNSSAALGLSDHFFFDDLGEFFLNSSCRLLLAFGCRGRGASLRHPWRASRR